MSSPLPGARFVDPTVLGRIGNLELVARTVVDGFLNGLHKSPFFGASVDFAEHRGYTPGDDIRRVDWRLYARTDRYYVKEYEADSNANFTVVLDVSKSMGFGSGAITKLDYAKYLAACLSYFANRQRDRVGIVTFDRDVVDLVPCSAKHLDLVLHTLDRATPREAGAFETAFRKVAERFSRRGLMVAISDFYEDPATLSELITPLKVRGHDLIVFHVLDPVEIDFPYEAPATFEDLETGDQIPVVPDTLSKEYRELMRQHVRALTTLCTESRIDYALFNTSVPLDHALFSFLSARERLSRVR